MITGTDIAAEVAACVLFWQRRPLAGLLVRLAPPAAAIAALSRAPVAAGASAPPGPGGARTETVVNLTLNHAVRAAGDVLLLWGAWRRRTPVILAGAAVVAVGWTVRVAGPGAEPDQPAPGPRLTAGQKTGSCRDARTYSFPRRG